MYVTNSHSLNKFGASEKKTLQIPITFFGSPFFSSNAWQNLRQKIPSNQQVAGFATWIPPMAASRLSTVRKISRLGCFALTSRLTRSEKLGDLFFGGPPGSLKKFPEKWNFAEEPRNKYDFEEIMCLEHICS